MVFVGKGDGAGKLTFRELTAKIISTFPFFIARLLLFLLRPASSCLLSLDWSVRYAFSVELIPDWLVVSFNLNLLPDWFIYADYDLNRGEDEGGKGKRKVGRGNTE